MANRLKKQHEINLIALTPMLWDMSSAILVTEYGRGV